MQNKTHYANLTLAMNVFKDRKLRFEPGTEFYYSSYGYVVLGVLIEKVSGLTYETYMTVNIWDKVGMTTTCVEQFNQTYANKSQLYHFEKKKSELGKQNNLSNRIPAGGFFKRPLATCYVLEMVF